MTNELNALEIIEVKNRAREKLGLCRKGNDIIGTQIFAILGLYARVIYYPLGMDAPWGFTRISGTHKEAVPEKPFVAINSSIPIDSQVFAAAHELYHIWYGQKPDILPADLLNEQDKGIHEKKANRFAAEFLVDEFLLKQEIEIYQMQQFTIKNILQLAELFTVPYRMMVKRLKETGMLSETEANQFLGEDEEAIDKYKIRYSVSLQKSDNRIVLDNLVELAVTAYESGYISYEKFEYLLRMSNLEPDDLGMKKIFAPEFPSDDELDRIMEE